MPSRRTVLRSLSLASVVPVAGCVDDGAESPASPADGSETVSATDRPTERRTSPTPSPPDPTACSEPRRPRVPVADDDEVAPREYPENPETLTVETVERYVREFERAYKVNRAIERYDLSRYDFVSWGVRDVRVVDGGVRVEVGGHVAPFTGGATSTYHYDEDYVASYLVTEQAVWRAEASGGDPPDPPSGRLLVCTP